MLLHDQIFGRRCDGQTDAELLPAACDQILCEKRDDLLHIFYGERMEHHDLINPVDEFRLEQPFHFFHHP